MYLKIHHLAQFPTIFRPKVKEKDKFNIPDSISTSKHYEYFNFTNASKNPVSAAFSCQSLEYATPKSSSLSAKRLDFPEISRFLNYTSTCIPTTTTIQTNETIHSRKYLRSECIHETESQLLDTSIADSLLVTSPIERVPKKNSSKLRLKDICQNITKAALPLDKKQNVSEKYSVNDIKNRSPIQIQLDHETENTDDWKIPQKPSPRTFTPNKVAKIKDMLQKLENMIPNHLPARHKRFFYKNKNNASSTKISFEESIQLKKVKSIPTIKEIYTDYLKFGYDERSKRTFGRKDSRASIQSALCLVNNKSKKFHSPGHQAKGLSINKNKGQCKESIHIKTKPLHTLCSKENQVAFSRPATSNQGVGRVLKCSKQADEILEAAQSSAGLVRNYQGIRISSLSKEIKKSPKKKIWNTAHDHALEEIQNKTSEQIFGNRTIQPPQNPLTSKSSDTFHEKESEDTTKPFKRDFKRVRKAFIEAARNIKLLKLTSKDLYRKVFSSKPYENENAREFIHAAKLGNETSVELLISKNRYLVYDFDNVHQTALHWATKRGHKEVIESLVKFGADVNAKDLLGRTPLYFAIQANHIEIIKLLLYSKCDPWSTVRANYNQLVKNNPIAKYYLSKARQLHIMMAMTSVSQRQAAWDEQSWLLKSEPMSLRVNKLKNTR